MNAQGIDRYGYAFSRNPIILQDEFPDDAFDKNGGEFTVALGGTEIYQGRFFPPLRVELSDILDAFSNYFPEPPEDNTDSLILLADPEDMCNRNVHVDFEYSGYSSGFDFTVIPGGISRQNFKRMIVTGQNIFNARFFNYVSNFFLTTRTAGWSVILKESELFPLYFLTNRAMMDMEVFETVTRSSLKLGQLSSPAMYALDIRALRLQFFKDKGILPSVFEVYVDGSFSCRIVIERAELSKNRYRLKFRNSLGVFEVIELTGDISITPEYPGIEEASFMRYDSVYGGFTSERERIERKQSITIKTGVKRPDEVRFLMDMIGSEEVYLLDLMDLPIKVIPSVENYTYKSRPESPESFTLKLEIADSETNIMKDIIDGSEGMRPRIFSKQFRKQFN